MELKSYLMVHLGPLISDPSRLFVYEVQKMLQIQKYIYLASV